jgi:hypothetical protein
VPKIKEMINILKRTKHSSPKPVFCPICYSSKLKQNESYGILPKIYYCEKCDYQGPLVIELELDAEIEP